MKKLICFFLTAILCFSLCGCSLDELGTASEVFSSFQSQMEALILENSNVVEIEVEEYYVWSPEFDACYNSLNSKQRKLYKVFYAAAEQMPDGFIKLCEDYADVTRDIHLAYTAMLNDNTEIFWMPNTYLIGTIKGSTNTINIAFNHTEKDNSVSYTVSRKERDQKRKELENKVDEALELVSGLDDQYKIEKIFNDYICANTSYDTNAYLSGTSYGCLVGGKALCEGYSRAFKLLCNEAGIECDLISGISQGEGHMWNSVNIDGIHNFVDVTWNDTSEELLYLYFNITGEQLLYDHSFSPVFTSLSGEKICSGESFNFFERDATFTGNTYFAKNDLVLNYGYEDKIVSSLREAATDGLSSCAFLITNKDLIKSLKKDPDKVLNDIQYRITDITITQYIFERDVLVLFFDVSD